MEEYKQMYVSDGQKKQGESLSAFMPKNEPESRDSSEMKDRDARQKGDEKDGSSFEKKEGTDRPLQGKVEGGSVYYKTGDVAEELNITDQDVRNYAQFFEDILQVEKTPSGHRRFTRENIDKLAAILQLKQQNNYTFEQIRDLLRSDEGKIVTAGDDLSRLRELMAWTLNQMSSIVKSEVSSAISENEALLQDKYEKDNIALLEDKEKKEKELQEAKKEVEDLKTEKDGIQKEIEELKRDRDLKEEEIASLQSENERIRRQLAELSKKKWYEFWKQ